MTVAQGILKQTVVGEQSGLGTAKTGSGGQILRRTSSQFELAKSTFTTDEIVTHQQSTGVGFGIDTVTGKIDGLVSAGTYQILEENLLRADYAAVSAISSLSLTIAASGSNYTVTRGSGDFLTGGITAGMVVRLTGGSLNSNNVSKNLFVVSLTATALTVRVLGEGLTLTAEGPIASCTVTPVGKFCAAPLTGHTNTYLTFEEWYSGVALSELYIDCKVGKADYSIPSTGNATNSFEIAGLSRDTNGSQQMTSPTAETTTGVMTGATGVVYVNGSAVAYVTGASVSIDGMVKAGDAVIGSSNAPDLDRGRISVTGSFSYFFTDGTIRDLYDAETAISLVLVMAADNSATSDFKVISLGRIKLTSDAADDGEKQIVRSTNFTAELNSAGGAALAWRQTICTLQDSQAT